jgi:hypothetical protein
MSLLIGTRCTFLQAWLCGGGGGLKFPAGTKNVSLQMAHPNSETTRYPIAKGPARISDA